MRRNLSGVTFVFERPLACAGEARRRGRTLTAVLVAVMAAGFLAAAPGAEAKGPGGSAASLSVGDVQVVEGSTGATEVVVAVRLSKALGQMVTVQVATAPGSATAGADYTTVNTTVVFNKRQTVANVVVPITGDTIDEANEQFSVLLTSPWGASIADGTGVVTILDDDEPAPPPPTPADVRLVLSDDEFDKELLTGDSVIYTLGVTNLGPGTATDLRVVDRIPAGMEFVSADPECSLGTDGATVSCTRSTLAPSAQWRPTILAELLEVDTYVNTGQLTAATPDPNLANNNDSELTEVDGYPNANVVVLNAFVTNQTGSPIAAWGSSKVVDPEGKYIMQVIVKNEGPTRADGVVVEAYDIDDNSILADTFCTPAPTEVTGTFPEPQTAAACAIGSLAVGAERTVLFELTFEPGYRPSTDSIPYGYEARTTLFDVRTTTLFGQSGSDSDGIVSYAVAQEGDAFVRPSFRGPASAPIGRDVTIAGTVSNFGPWPATGISLSVHLSTGVQLVQPNGLTCGGEIPTSSGTYYTCTYTGLVHASSTSNEMSLVVRSTTLGSNEVSILVDVSGRNHASSDSSDGQLVTFNTTLV